MTQTKSKIESMIASKIVSTIRYFDLNRRMKNISNKVEIELNNKNRTTKKENIL